jgi:arylsulfatase A-like enzyme
MSELFPHLSRHADDLAVIRSSHGDAFDHAPAIFLRCTGSQFPGRPALGSWLVYGLGSENRNLPSFVVMSDGAMKSGAGAYGSGYLPAVYQGTVFRTGPSPVLNLKTPQDVTAEAQKSTLDFIDELNRRHYATREQDTTLDARIRSHELAFRMQAEAPDAVATDNESEETKKLYGLDEPMTENFGRKCLLARRLVERGVRFVELFFGTNLGDDWDDAHNDLLGSHIKMTRKSEKPIAALIQDLKARGLFDSTLIVWNSEFGRTPLAEGKNGRDHHPYGFSMWMAGAGIKGGRALGATDEFGLRAVDQPKSVHDVHATILRLLGVDHTQLTYRYQSRDQRLTDVHGEHEFTDWLLRG